MHDIKIARALSIRQPFADMILKGKKKIEYRSLPTKILNETVYIYAPKQYRTDVKGYPVKKLEKLPKGLIVGTVRITKSVKSRKYLNEYEWHLAGAKRVRQHIKPKERPQPVWFRPF